MPRVGGRNGEEEKVAQLRKEIEAGTYQRSADDIAGKMIREGLINDGVK